MSTGDSSESFTPAEAAYFKSGGTDTAALEAENAGSSSEIPNSSREGFSNAVEKPADGDIENPDELVTLGPDGKPRDGKGRFVPHQAFHEVREKYKATRDELHSTKEKFARADERLAILNEVLGKAGEPAPASAAADVMPDPQVDPIGALQFATRKIQALESQLNETKQQAEDRENSRAMKDAYIRDAQAYLKQAPEFGEAYEYLVQSQHEELMATGMHDQARRMRMVAQQERAIVQQALDARISPAQMIHRMAIARGFKPASVPAKDAANDPMKRIGELAQAQKTAGASLTNAGGTSGEGLTLAALADMDEEQFAAVSAKLGKAKMRELMGG